MEAARPLLCTNGRPRPVVADIALFVVPSTRPERTAAKRPVPVVARHTAVRPRRPPVARRALQGATTCIGESRLVVASACPPVALGSPSILSFDTGAPKQPSVSSPVGGLVGALAP